MPVQNGKQSGILESASASERQRLCAIIGITGSRINNETPTTNAKINHSAADKYFQWRCPRKVAGAIGHGYRPVIYHRLNGRNAPLLLERAVR